MLFIKNYFGYDKNKMKNIRLVNIKMFKNIW